MTRKYCSWDESDEQTIVLRDLINTKQLVLTVECEIINYIVPFLFIEVLTAAFQWITGTMLKTDEWEE
jgi:hypothetical protein